MTEKKYQSFWSFYPYYLTEHRKPVTRALHFIGTFLVFVCLVMGIATGHWGWFVALPLCGYGLAWVGHFFVEHNKPATFVYPLYSLGSDFVMFWHILTGQINNKLAEADRLIN